MTSLDFLDAYRDAEAHLDATEQTWYLAATAAIAGAMAGHIQGALYRKAVDGLPLEKELIVQRRLKEALTKISILIGNPRALSSMIPMFKEFKEDGIDTFAPRTEELGDEEALKRRVQRAEHHFNTLWTKEGADNSRALLQKYAPDAYLLGNKWGYEYWLSEDRILSLIDTEVALAAAITTTHAPVQAAMHTRGIVRVGGSKDLAERSQNLALEVGKRFNAPVGDIELVKDMKFDVGLDMSSFGASPGAK